MTITLKATVRVSPQFRVTLTTPDGPISPRAYSRDGGKPAAKSLLKPIKPNSKRARFLRWFLESEDGKGRSIGATMTNFSLSRANVISYWTALQRDHGVGYAITNNTITPRLPSKCDPSELFGV
jgi:hypothetical protein